MKNVCIGFISALFTFIILTFNVHAVPHVFFAEDMNFAGGLRITEYPNSISAQNDFLSHLQNVRVEDFESFNPKSTDLKIDFGDAGTAEINGGYISGLWDSRAIRNGRFSTSGSGDHFLEVQSNEDPSQLGTASFNLTFELAQSAFGFFATDFENSLTSLSFHYLDGETVNIDIPFTKPSPTGSVLFFGIIDEENPFVGVDFEGIDIIGNKNNEKP